VDGGGAPGSGGSFAIEGTAGQPDTGGSAGASFAVLGGFWAPAVGRHLFSDGFESGDLSGWSSVVPGPGSTEQTLPNSDSSLPTPATNSGEEIER
jgi:hypothetical protein